MIGASKSVLHNKHTLCLMPGSAIISLSNKPVDQVNDDLIFFLLNLAEVAMYRA